MFCRSVILLSFVVCRRVLLLFFSMRGFLLLLLFRSFHSSLLSQLSFPFAQLTNGMIGWLSLAKSLLPLFFTLLLLTNLFLTLLDYHYFSPSSLPLYRRGVRVFCLASGWSFCLSVGQSDDGVGWSVYRMDGRRRSSRMWRWKRTAEESITD